MHKRVSHEMVMASAANSIRLARQASKLGMVNPRYAADARFNLAVAKQHRDKLPKLPG